VLVEGAVVTLPGLDLASMADLLAAQLFAMLRIGAFLIASPAFGGRFVPLPVRIVAAVCRWSCLSYMICPMPTALPPCRLYHWSLPKSRWAWWQGWC